MAAPLRHQLLAVGAILAFTAGFGGCVAGLRAGGGVLYAEPACETLCGARRAKLTDIDYRVGKRDNHSFCVCSDGGRVEAPEANFVANASVLLPILLMAVLPLAFAAFWSSRR